MELNKRSFALYNTKVNDWYAGSGTYEILIGSSSRDIRLTKTVELESTMKIPMEIHTNTTISELMENEKAKEVMKDLVDQMMANIGGGEQGCFVCFVFFFVLFFCFFVCFLFNEEK